MYPMISDIQDRLVKQKKRDIWDIVKKEKIFIDVGIIECKIKPNNVHLKNPTN